MKYIGLILASLLFLGCSNEIEELNTTITSETPLVVDIKNNVDTVAPIFISLPFSSVKEKQKYAITLLAEDANSNVEYSIKGSDADKFVVDTTTGEVRFKLKSNYTLQNEYFFTAIARDEAGNSSTQSIEITLIKLDEDRNDTILQETTVTIIDVDENQTEDSALVFKMASEVYVDENQLFAIRLVIEGSLSDVTYSVSKYDAVDFNVDAKSGVVSFKSFPDYENKVSYTFEAKATDMSGKFVVKNITIKLNDIVELENEDNSTTTTPTFVPSVSTMTGLSIEKAINISDISKERIIWIDDYKGKFSPYDDATYALIDAVIQCNESDTLNVIGMRGKLPFSKSASSTRQLELKKDILFFGLEGSSIEHENVLRFTATLTLDTSIAQNITRGDKTIFLNSVENIKIGDLFSIRSDEIGEIGWKYKKNDVSPIVAIDAINKSITISESPNFSYDSSILNSVKVYEHREFTIQNISFSAVGINKDNGTNTISFNGFSKITNTDLTFYYPAGVGAIGFLYSNSYNLTFKNLLIDGGLYSFFLANCRNIFADGIESKNCRHPFDTNGFSTNIEVKNVTGYNNTATLESHPSFDVYWHNVNFIADTQLPSIRAVGIRVEDINGSSIQTENLSTQWAVQLVDRTIVTQYENRFKNITVKTPFCRFFLSQDVRMKATYDNCTVYGIRISKELGFTSNSTIKNSNISAVETVGNIDIDNTHFFRDATLFKDDRTWALTLSANIVNVTNSTVEGYDYVSNYEYANQINWTNTTFKDIAIDLVGGNSAGSGLVGYQWKDCIFDKVNAFERYKLGTFNNKITNINPTYINTSDRLLDH